MVRYFGLGKDCVFRLALSKTFLFGTEKSSSIPKVYSGVIGYKANKFSNLPGK